MGGSKACSQGLIKTFSWQILVGIVKKMVKKCRKGSSEDCLSKSLNERAEARFFLSSRINAIASLEMRF